jgi:hypothetical protein
MMNVLKRFKVINLNWFLKPCRSMGCFLLLMLSAAQVNAAQVFCIFDVAGTSGQTMQFIQSYALSAKKWGANLSFVVYRDELQAVNAFKEGKCQGIAATGFATRQFNSYTGSLSAVGAIPSNALARTILGLLASEKLAPDMLQNGYEAVGVFPGGLAYLLVKDRQLNSLEKIQGKRMGVLEIDPPQQRMVAQIGAVPVYVTTANAGLLFQNNTVDILPLPVIAFEPLEVYRSMGKTGGIVRFPITFLTMSVIIKPEHFPKNYGKQSRTWFARESSQLMNILTKKEADVPASLWIDLSSQEKVNYLRLLRQMRLEFLKNGTFNPKMMGLLKRLRCQQEPRSFECPLKDE